MGPWHALLLIVCLAMMRGASSTSYDANALRSDAEDMPCAQYNDILRMTEYAILESMIDYFGIYEHLKEKNRSQKEYTRLYIKCIPNVIIWSRSSRYDSI